MIEGTEEFKRVVRKELKNAVKRFYSDVKQTNYKILTPEDGYAIIFEHQYTKDNNVELLKLTKPKLRKFSSKPIYLLSNTESSLVNKIELEKAKTSDEWEHIAIFKWTPLKADRFLWNYNIQYYEFYPQVLYFNPSQKDRKNCYIQKYKLSDMVSGDTFDTFKDLYNFSKI